MRNQFWLRNECSANGMNLFNYSPKNHTIGLKISMDVLNAG
jgi:hypothetical protein